MIEMTTEVLVRNVSSQEIYAFMLTCSDSDYQEWWPGMHLAFHTVRRTPGDLGNLVYFDEFIGTRRLRSYAVVTRLIERSMIVWQLKIGIRLPIWITLELGEGSGGVMVRHTVSAGFSGPGRLLDWLFKPLFSKRFVQALDEHAQTEFPLLAELLLKRREV